MIPTITAFEASPDRGRGLARDMKIRLGSSSAPSWSGVKRLGIEVLSSVRAFPGAAQEIVAYQNGSMG